MKSALLVGLNYSRTPYALQGCINDVTRMRSLLLANGYLPQNMTTLVDSDAARMPTRARILQELTRLVSTNSTELLFH